MTNHCNVLKLQSRKIHRPSQYIHTCLHLCTCIHTYTYTHKGMHIIHTQAHHGKTCHKLNKKVFLNGECSKSTWRKLFLSNPSAHVGRRQVPNKYTLQQYEHLFPFFELALFNRININQLWCPQQRISEVLVLHWSLHSGYFCTCPHFSLYYVYKKHCFTFKQKISAAFKSIYANLQKIPFAH